MGGNRTQNSIKNIYMSIFGQVVMILLGFISRKVFVDSLGSEYLGINGLFSSIISMMSLVEGGIGVSIVYNLYKPLAERDEEKIIALVQLYKKLYTILAIIIITLSLAIYPFLKIIIKDLSGVQYIWVVYILFVLKNCISYLNAHKWSLINADQRGYVLAKYIVCFDFTTTIVKIIVLTTTNNYLLYIFMEFIIFSIQTIWNGKIVSKEYPYIKTENKIKVESSVKNDLIRNVKALFLHKFGGWIVFGTDNILVSIIVNIKTLGIYSNYTMIIEQINSLVGSFIDGIGASIGNLIATENGEKNYEIFKLVNMVSFFIYSISTIVLFNIVDLFITWWLGEGMIIDKLTLVIVLLNFYIRGMRNVVLTFKIKGGIFVRDKYIPLVEAIINLSCSLILAKYFGLAGIFMGTTLSTLVLPIWLQPLLVYKYIFKKSFINYIKSYINYFMIMVVSGGISNYICNLFVYSGFFTIVLYGIISVMIPIIIYSITFYKTDEFKKIIELVVHFSAKVKSLFISVNLRN